MSRKKAVEEIYQKKSPREHVLLRPDTYVGSVERDKEKMFVMNEESNRMEEEEIEYVPALYKIFDEILVNAADNKQRDASMKEIRIKIDIESGCIEIRNDGKGIPVEIHKEHKIYIPELIFGHLLTSSNYNDADLKTVGGRNGFGAKLANIFSKQFVVETVDSAQRKKYKQRWTANMSKKEEPQIDELSAVRTLKDYTKIVFYPDFGRFGMQSLHNEQIVKLFIKRVYDIAGTTAKDLSVSLKIVGGDDLWSKYNGSRLAVRSFVDYVKLFIGADVRSKQDYFQFTTDDEKWDVVLALNPDNDYRQISHVNNIWTIQGGQHVKYVENQFIKYFKDNFKAKEKKLKEMLKPKMIRDHLFVFINALIVNPTFSSQTKEVLTTKPAAFGSTCKIPEDVNKKLMNKLKTTIKDLLSFKLDQAAKKTDGRKKQRVNLPPEVDDANLAGQRGKSAQCTLIITEGLSAKTLAVAGVAELPGAKNKYGIFPLKGKLLNVRDAPRSQINKNAEINNLKQALGLQHKTKYNDKKTISGLRYGKVMIMTDQDTDGSHIKGLMINLLHSEWPELIHHQMFGPNGNESFVEQFITPIVVASKGKTQREAFYSIPQYEEWKKANNDGKGWKIKYYKGLGTWQRSEGKEHFRNLRKHRIAFRYKDNEDDLSIVKAFGKDKADLRKQWISEYTDKAEAEALQEVNDQLAGSDSTNTHNNNSNSNSNGNGNGNNRLRRSDRDLDYKLVQSRGQLTYQEFINKDLITFSVNDLHRSIPSLCDGLKPGQRKILYCCFLKNNLKTEIRVAQLGGYVSEKSAYHHGETSLYQTIVGMAQDFVGSNNINLLSPNGMFGSRIRGGKDAASPRYIHTALSKITRKIFHSLDDMILEYQDDDGYPVEPKFYVPIIPMVLINGAMGIGTGWSTQIPNYNPNDIIKNIRRKLAGEEFIRMHPFYRGFKGEITAVGDGDGDGDGNQHGGISSYRTYGKASIINTFTDGNGVQYSTIQVTELPVQIWTENYKKFLMDLEDTDQIENVNNMSSDIDVAFTFDVQHKERPNNKTASRARSNHNHNHNASTTETNSNSASPQRNGGANQTRKSKKNIYFTGSLDEQFLKDMKLSSSISCTNMVLFDANGKIKKYENVQQILDEFYETRLKAYGLRKKALLNSMQHELTKISNQARFILMVINEELRIAKRKKSDIIQDLKDHGFDAWKPSKNSTNTLRNRAKATDAFENEEEKEEKEEDADKDDVKNKSKSTQHKDSFGGYSYLLSMALSSLTKENVDELLKRKQDTIDKVTALQQKSVKDLWRDDLDELDQDLNEYQKQYEQNVQQMRKEALAKAGKMATATKSKSKSKAKSKAKPKSQSKAKATAKSKTATKPQETAKPEAASQTKSSSISKTTKKKLLSTSSGTNPFSMAKKASKQQTKAMEVEPELELESESDSESESAGNQKLSLFERANKKRQNTPQNTRKRKRESLDVEKEEQDDENEHEEQSVSVSAEPPRKKRNTRNAGKRKRVLLDSEDDDDEEDEDDLYIDEDQDDDDESEDSEEYKPPTKASSRSPARSRSRSRSQSSTKSKSKSKSKAKSKSKSPTKSKSKKKKQVSSDEDDDEDFDIDEAEENVDHLNVKQPEKRTLLKRTVKAKPKYADDDGDDDEDYAEDESTYNLSDDLEIAESEEDDD